MAVSTSGAVEVRAQDGSATDAHGSFPAARVVFLSGDPVVVQPMRNAASSTHHSWDIRFVESEPAARALLAEPSGVGVLVAHVSATGSPVAELLAWARRSSPSTVRVVLSGRNDHDLLRDLIGLAHRFVSLPLDVEALTELIDHVASATATELGEPVRSLVGQVDRLPSPPAMFRRLTEILSSPDWSIGDLSREIADDVALTGEILKLVNSPFYGAANRVVTVDGAITLLGVDMIRFLVLGNKVFQPDDGLESWIDLERLAHRSKAVGLGARALAIRDRAPSATAATAYLAGLVSEIGLLVLGRVPGIAPAIARPVNDSTFLGAERAMFGGDRFAVGARLLALWGFDPAVVEAVGRLSDNGGHGASDLSWFLVAARRLVVDEGVDPYDLASRVGAKPELDEALERIRLDFAAAASNPGVAPSR